MVVFPTSGRTSLGGVSGWAELGLVVGVVAGVLTGALLVVLAVRLEALASPALRPRAAQALGLLLTVVVAGVLLTLTGQGAAALGAELIVLAVLTGVVAVLVDRRVRTPEDGAGVRIFELGTPNLLVAALTAAAGICLLAGEAGGLYQLAVAVVGALVGGVVNAWLLLTGLAGRVPSGSPLAAP
jgi:hypothetical protein